MKHIFYDWSIRLIQQSYLNSINNEIDKLDYYIDVLNEKLDNYEIYNQPFYKDAKMVSNMYKQYNLYKLIYIYYKYLSIHIISKYLMNILDKLPTVVIHNIINYY